MIRKGFVVSWLPITALAAICFTPTSPAWAQFVGAPPNTVLGVECSRVAELGIDKMMNVRAHLILMGCGLEEPAQPAPTAPGGGPKKLQPIGPPINVNSITGAETYPKVTQSESMVWSSDGQTIVINYNDSRDSASSPRNYSGVSVSTDGGASFERLLPSPFSTGHLVNYGDPVVVFNQALGLWFAGDLATGCGGQGTGLWTSRDGLTWTPGACAHRGNRDDRESMWVDNQPASPWFGRMYVSWNNFGLPADPVQVSYSDDGDLWSDPVTLTPGTFIRNVQLTGSPSGDGTVFLAGMDEGGGGLNSRTNIMYRSTDGGDTWTSSIMGDPFAPPGETGCGYFARIAPIWRHMGWGQPGVGPNGVVHYAYAGRGSNSVDKGDIYYTRSLDNGDTWSDPIVLNSDQADGGTREQWMPSLSVTASGDVQVYWYDRRDSTDGLNYEVWGIESRDNGATWLADAPISDVLIPQPQQPDPNVQACYAGDYNYSSAFSNHHYMTWTDGRNQISGHFQQDVYFAKPPE